MMSKLTRFATPLMAVAMMSSVPFMTLAQNSPAGNATKSTTTATVPAAWNTAPPGTKQAQQGYLDGIEGAQLDRLANRKIDAKSSHMYLHPPVKSQAREVYRLAFESGYEAAVKHAATT